MEHAASVRQLHVRPLEGGGPDLQDLLAVVGEDDVVRLRAGGVVAGEVSGGGEVLVGLAGCGAPAARWS